MRKTQGRMQGGRMVAAVLAGALLVGACADDEGGATRTGDRPRVVAAFFPLFEAARRVGGDRAGVVNLTAAGTEPHALELTSDQVDRIEAADVVIYLGNGFQPAVEEVARRAEGEIVDALDGAKVEDGDPHVWLDPALLGEIVERVEAALVKVDPAGKAGYAENSAAYRNELGLLDDEFGQRLATCERRVIVTAHSAFGYLARRYRLTQEPIAGLAPESEPDPQRLAELADLVKSTGTTTVFTETLVSPRVAETLAREAAVTTAVLNPLEGLSESEIAAGGSYVAVMKDNLAALTGALGCAG
ncbi:MAG: metal ABC transporter substrate-binding protein [Acidimicrobiia bacterium]